MHPHIAYSLAQINIDELLQSAERDRLVQAARKDRPRPIDFTSLGERLRLRIFGGPTLRGRPTAGAPA
jgi:hypothetical protein